jgi:hypothetical protein
LGLLLPPGVEPVFQRKISNNHRTARVSAPVKFAFLIQPGDLERTIPFTEADRKL